MRMSSMVDVKHTEQCNCMGPCDTITPSVLLIPLSEYVTPCLGEKGRHVSG